MKNFAALTEVIDRLLGPDGCPWDREQTFASMRSPLMEETCEVIEAIDLDDDESLLEELGDLLFQVLFLCRLAEKEQRFTLEEVLKQAAAKFIRRHPHVFGEAECRNVEEVRKQWEAIKQDEPKGQQRRSALDGIPHPLPSLARAQKMIKKIKSLPPLPPLAELSPETPEEAAGRRLWNLTQEIAEQGLHAEQALQRRLTLIDAAYRTWEESNPLQ